MEIKDKVGVITGAAGGIGLSIVKNLLSNDIKVSPTTLRTEKLYSLYFKKNTVLSVYSLV